MYHGSGRKQDLWVYHLDVPNLVFSALSLILPLPIFFVSIEAISPFVRQTPAAYTPPPAELSQVTTRDDLFISV